MQQQLMMQKNPFEKEFEWANKNRYARNVSIANSTSPLNTPSIPLTDGGNAFAAHLLEPPTAIPFTSLVVPTPIQQQQSTATAATIVTTTTTTTAAASTDLRLNIESSSSGNVSNQEHNHRSNFVSVICTPTLPSNAGQTKPTPATTNIESNNADQDMFMASRSPSASIPQLSLPEAGNSNNGLNLVIPTTEPMVVDFKQDEIVNNNVAAATTTTAAAASNVPEVQVNETQFGKQVTLVVTLPDDDSNLSMSDWKSIAGLSMDTNGNDPLVKIYPKPYEQQQSNNKTKNTKLSSLTMPKRKEKSLEELLEKIVQTEAALPPKAKPGRKSKTASMAEDLRERKRRSLERNRAAAMRCRLKKKKEIDELKVMLDKLEEENNNLKVRMVKKRRV